MRWYIYTAIALMFTSQANATLISVSEGSTSSVGVSAAIIAAPEYALDDKLTNEAQQGFDEIQNYLLLADINIDGGGSIAAGTRVDSHMIFLNCAGCLGASFLSHPEVEWIFSGAILGVMSDRWGSLEDATSGILGAVGTIYETPFWSRGMENGPGGPASTGVDPCDVYDCYAISGSTLTVDMRVTQPGDWIRVVTASVPEPGTLALLALGLMGLGVARRKKAT